MSQVLVSGYQLGLQNVLQNIKTYKSYQSWIIYLVSALDL